MRIFSYIVTHNARHVIVKLDIFGFEDGSCILQKFLNLPFLLRGHLTHISKTLDFIEDLRYFST